jgi:hypothetical protein
MICVARVEGTDISKATIKFAAARLSQIQAIFQILKLARNRGK